MTLQLSTKHDNLQLRTKHDTCSNASTSAFNALKTAATLQTRPLCAHAHFGTFTYHYLDKLDMMFIAAFDQLYSCALQKFIYSVSAPKHGAQHTSPKVSTAPLTATQWLQL
jgi:hypothetical protein